MTESFSQCRPAGWRDNRQEPTGPDSTGNAGFALPGVLLALVLLGAIAVVSMMTTGHDRMTGRALRESAKAFYAAEAGANAIIAEWNQAGYDTLLAGPGDSLDLGWRTLENNLSYWAMLRRVDGSSGPRLYTISVTGRGLGVLGGQRVVGVVMRTTTTTLSVDGAFVGIGRLDVGSGGGVVVDGADYVPPNWATTCDAPGDAMPGIVLQDTSALTISGSPTVTGTPPLQENSAFSTSDFDALWDQLVAMADKVYPISNPDLSNIGPVLTGGGECDESVLDNWGAPEDPNHACFNYFPIIYVQNGRLKTAAGRSGQGILLVDLDSAGTGDLEIEDGFCFYGLVLVQGEFELETGSSGTNPPCLYGSVMVKNYGDPIKSSKIWTGAELRYSSCVMERIAANTAAAGAAPTRPLAQGGWWQAMN